jgi:hypothetical protein
MITPGGALKAQKKDSNEDSDTEDNMTILQFKVILLGDGSVGKTSIASRYCQDKFGSTYKQTIGCDFFLKRVRLTCKFPMMFNNFCNDDLSSEFGVGISDLGYWRTVYWKQNDRKLCRRRTCMHTVIIVVVSRMILLQQCNI